MKKSIFLVVVTSLALLAPVMVADKKDVDDVVYVEYMTSNGLYTEVNGIDEYEYDTLQGKHVLTELCDCVGDYCYDSHPYEVTFPNEAVMSFEKWEDYKRWAK